MTKNLNDYGKLLVLLTGLVGALVYALVGLITENDAAQLAGVGLAGTIIGYVTGNGRLAVRQEPPSPLLSPTLDRGAYVHRDELEALDQLPDKELDKLRSLRLARVREEAALGEAPARP